MRKHFLVETKISARKRGVVLKTSSCLFKINEITISHATSCKIKSLFTYTYPEYPTSRYFQKQSFYTRQTCERSKRPLNCLRWPIYVINSVDNTKLPWYTLPPTQHHSFFKNLIPILRLHTRQISELCYDSTFQTLWREALSSKVNNSFDFPLWTISNRIILILI